MMALTSRSVLLFDRLPRRADGRDPSSVFFFAIQFSETDLPAACCAFRGALCRGAVFTLSGARRQLLFRRVFSEELLPLPPSVAVWAAEGIATLLGFCGASIKNVSSPSPC